MADVFLSYSRENQVTARRFAEELEREGLSVWWDQALSAGQAFDTVTEQALADAHAVVVLWSKHSVDSRWVRAEATEAERSRKLVPVMIESCKRPILFELVHTAELSHWKGDREDPAWKGFIRDLHGITRMASDPNRAIARALPAAHGNDPIRRNWFVWTLAVSALVLMLAVAFVVWRHGKDQPARSGVPVQIEAFTTEGGEQTSTTAQAFRNTVQEVLGKTGLQTTFVTKLGTGPGLGVKGSVIRDADRLKFYVLIEDLKSGASVWSEQFAGSPAAADALGVRAAVAAAESFSNIRQAETQKGLKVDPELLARFIEGLNLVTVGQSLQVGRDRQIFEDIIARAPQSALAHATLSLVLANSLSRQSPEQRALQLQQVQAEAQKAIQLDPAASGPAYDALYKASTVISPRDLARQQEQLFQGLKQAPDFPFLSMRTCESLLNVGRVKEALSYCQSAAAIRPLAVPIGWRLALALDMDHQNALADKAIAQTSYYNPDAAAAQIAQFRLLVFGEAPVRAQAMLLQLQASNPALLEGADTAFQALLDARGSGSKEKVEKAVSAILAATKSSRLSLGDAVKGLAELSRLDEAFALIQGADAIQISGGGGLFSTYFLFEPASRPLRRDPRFWQMATNLGLVEYWQKLGKWPDFCAQELEPGTCQSAAAGAAAAGK
jgi:tetratricopeptide (TPR) repeat protein